MNDVSSGGGPRYADGPTTEVEVHVEAEPAAVWRYVTDIELPARFSEEFLGARWLDGADACAVGARFAGRNRHEAIGEWETTCTVVEVEPERVLTYAVTDPDRPSATWRFRLEPTDEGTRLSQWVRLGPGPSGLTPAIERAPDKEERIVAARLRELRRNMQATLEGIKALAERG